MKVNEFDFGKYHNALVVRDGISDGAATAAVSDLKIILAAMERQPGKAFALTAAADKALHWLLTDTVAHIQFSEAIFGHGALIVHDPYAWGTPEFSQGWANTRNAMAEEGISLVEDYHLSIGDDHRSRAEMCLLRVRQISELRMAA